MNILRIITKKNVEIASVKTPASTTTKLGRVSEATLLWDSLPFSAIRQQHSSCVPHLLSTREGDFYG